MLREDDRVSASHRHRLTFSKDGQVLDQIEIPTAQDPDMLHASSGGRMRDCAVIAANDVLLFLKKANK